MTYFGTKLRALRAARGLSQAELAQQLGLTKSSVNMYERGEREPGFDTLTAIALYFGCGVDELLGIPKTVHADRLAEAAPQSPDASLSPDEQALLERYRALDEAGREYVRRSAELAALSSRQKGENR